MSAPAPAILQRRLPVHNRQDVLVDDQDLNDIIKAIKKYHKVHQANYDDISEEFWTGDPHTTSKQLFDFLKKYIHYKVEPEHDQTIKSPGRIIKEGYGDCKHYASFISGVVDSLERKGYPIHCIYRFVSDHPGRDVHHVFSVVSDKDQDYWVDPVLQSFDQRPQFYSTKDISFSHGIGRLTYLSGTDAEIGKFSFKKAWDQVKHSVDVNLHNAGQAVKKIEHGAAVNLHNAGKAVKKIEHGMSVNLHNAGKGIEKAAQAVKHVALKVAGAPARNAFLALLDINAFNLGNRVAHALQGPQANGLRDTWKKLGGDPGKLAQAARNGQLFQAKLHKRDPKSIHGYGCVGMGATFHSDMITTHPGSWTKDHWARKHRRQRGGIYGAQVGLEPVTTASLMALASGILAVLAKFLGSNNQEQAAMADQAKEGIATIAEQAAAADGGGTAADALTNLTTPTGGADATMSVNTGVDEYGQPQVTVQDVKHPALTNAGDQDGGAGADTAKTDQGPGFLEKFEDQAKLIWTNHKGMVIGTGIALIALSSKPVRRKLGMK